MRNFGFIWVLAGMLAWAAGARAELAGVWSADLTRQAAATEAAEEGDGDEAAAGTVSAGSAAAKEPDGLTQALRAALAVEEEDDPYTIHPEDLEALHAGKWKGKAGVVGVRDGSGATGAFSADDEGSNYTAGEDWLGQDGGKGFGAWELKADGATVSREVATEQGETFFKMAGSTEGESVAWRTLDSALVEGTFSMTMDQASFDSADFLGFAVFGADGGELLRWGVGVKEGDAFLYRTAGATEYSVAAWGYPSGTTDFSLTWSQVAGGGLSFELSGTYITTPVAMEVAGATSVAGIGVVLMDGWREPGLEDAAIGFNNLRVTGTPAPSVPEPGVLGLLAVGGAGLFRGARRKKEKGGRNDETTK